MRHALFERWGAGVETQKNVRREIGGWGRVPFNENYAPSLSTIYDGAQVSLNFLKMVLDPSPPPLLNSLETNTQIACATSAGIHVCHDSMHMRHDSMHMRHDSIHIRHDKFIYGVALVSRIDKIIGLFCKRALQKRRYSAKQTYNFINPTDRSHLYIYIYIFFYIDTLAQCIDTRVCVCDMTHSYVICFT